MVNESDLTPDLGAADQELDPLKFFSGEKLTPDQAAQELNPLKFFSPNAADEKPVEPPLAVSTAEAVQKLITVKSRRSGLGPKHRLIKATNQSSQDPESSGLEDHPSGQRDGELFYLSEYISPEYLQQKTADIKDPAVLKEIDSIQVFWSERSGQYELDIDDTASEIVREIVADYNSALGLDPRDQVSDDDMWAGKAA